MNTEKTFTIVGTAVNENGILKMRFANDMVSRIKILNKAKCSDIVLIELPNSMTKLEAAQYFLENTKLTLAQEEIVSLKIAEKNQYAKRADMKTTITKNVKNRIKNKTPTDPRVEKFVEQSTEKVK